MGNVAFLIRNDALKEYTALTPIQVTHNCYFSLTFNCYLLIVTFICSYPGLNS